MRAAFPGESWRSYLTMGGKYLVIFVAFAVEGSLQSPAHLRIDPGTLLGQIDAVRAALLTASLQDHVSRHST